MSRSPEFFESIVRRAERKFDDFFKGVKIEESGIERDWYDLFRGMWIDNQIEEHTQGDILDDKELSYYLQDFKLKYQNPAFPRQLLPENLVDSLVGERGEIILAHGNKSADEDTAGFAHIALMGMVELVNLDWGLIDINEEKNREDQTEAGMRDVAPFIAHKYASLMEKVSDSKLKDTGAISYLLFITEANARPLNLGALANFFERYEADRQSFQSPEA